MKDVFLALWDSRSDEEEGSIKGEFQNNMENSVVKRDVQRVPGAQVKGA